MLEAMWCGTVGLNTRSKAGQVPRLLLKIDMKNDFLLGRLTRFLKLQHEGMEGNQLRSTSDYVLSVEELINALQENAAHIKKVSYLSDPQLRITPAVPSDWHRIETSEWYK